MTTNILMIVAPKDFRDEEYFEPKIAFMEQEYNITTASLNTERAVGVLGSIAKVDIDIKDVTLDNIDAIVISGGQGSQIYQDNEIIHAILQKANTNNILIAAICIAPAILAKSEILMNKIATIWNGNGNQSKILENYGAIFKNEEIVIDGNIITANGPDVSEEFADTVVNFLKNK